MRRFRPGGHLDAALITASCVAIVSFARGASTDMQLAAPFCIGMLGWYAWYETGKKFWLFDLYFFGAAATLAKGPVAPFLALCIILLFAGLRREWSAAAPHNLDSWRPALSGDGTALVHRGTEEATRPFTVSSFSNTIWSASPPTVISTINPSGTTWLVLLLGLMPWTVIAFAL